jgi:hypothetical protein
MSSAAQQQRVKFRLQEERYSNEPTPNLMQQGASASSGPSGVSRHTNETRAKNQRSSMSMGSNSNSISKDDGQNKDDVWRKHGQTYRANLIAQDQSDGGGKGKALRISDHCAIERYYQVADKVQYQFLNHSVDTKDEFNEAYLVGIRLCKFLSEVLPTHQEYFSNEPKLRQLRTVSQAQLAELLPYLDQLERVIDEGEYQLYISQVLSPGDNEQTLENNDDSQWEDVEDEDSVTSFLLEDKELEHQEQQLQYYKQQQQEFKQLQQQQQQHQQQHHMLQHQQQQQQDTQKDTSYVNTTITSYDWTANNPNETSLDMDLILDGANSMIDQDEELEEEERQPRAQASRPPLQSALRHPGHQQLPPPKTPRRSATPSSASMAMPLSSRDNKTKAALLESPSQRAAAVDWDTAWQRTTLHQQQQENSPTPPNPKQHTSSKSNSGRGGGGILKYGHSHAAANAAQDKATDWQEDDLDSESAWESPTVTLQEKTRELSPVRPQREHDVSLVALSGIDVDEREVSQDNTPPQDNRNRNISAAAVKAKTKPKDTWAYGPDDGPHDEYSEDDFADEPPNPDVDQWNLAYSSVAPGWASAASSVAGTESLSSKWTMDLSMESSAFHQKQAAAKAAAAATGVIASPLPPPRDGANMNSKKQERRKKMASPMTRLSPVKESAKEKSPSSARSSKQSSISDRMRKDKDFADYIANSLSEKMREDEAFIDYVASSGLNETPSSGRSSRESSISDRMRHDEDYCDYIASSSSERMRQDEDFVDKIATAFRDQNSDLLLESKIEKRWKRAARKGSRSHGINHAFTTLRDGSPKSIIDMDNWNDGSGKRPLLLNKNDASAAASLNAVPNGAIRKQDRFSRLGEDADDDSGSEDGGNDNRALTRRGNALHSFKSCVRCLLD